MKKPWILLVLLLVPALAFAQQGSGSSTGSDAPAPSSPPSPPPAPPPTPSNDMRKTCVDAMNADPTFAESIVQKAYELDTKKCDLVDAVAAKRRLELDAEQHERAAAAVAKNQKHVIMAYAALWIIAAGFVMFLWRRQQVLRLEIAHLRADLDAATKDGK